MVPSLFCRASIAARAWHVVAILVVVVAILCVERRRAYLARTPSPPTFRGNHDATGAMVLCEDSAGNEALVLSAVLADEPTLFQLDTAYAGPPVISSSFLHLQREARDGANLQERYLRAMRLLRKHVSDDMRQKAINQLLRSGWCRSFTSGCTMRLMGIGETSEMQADMLLCPAIKFDGASCTVSVDADVLVTHPLQGGVHILTCDYLMHRHPCLVCPAEQTLTLALSPDKREAALPSFEFHPAYFVGGAFAVMMDVGGSLLRIVVDTGAAAPLSLGRTPAQKLKACRSPPGGHFHVTQTGVNGERVCSSALLAPVRIGTIDLGEVTAFVNGDEVEGADGYAGIALLRAVDLWLEPTRIGFRKNALPPRTAYGMGSAGPCSNDNLPRCAHS